MHLKALYSLLFLLASFFCFSQSDSVAYAPGMPIEDGIYLSYQDFRFNKGIAKSQIKSTQDKDQLEFISKVLTEEKITIITNGNENTFNSKDVWAYFQNNTFYINFKGEFYRVPVFGSISYLVAYVTVISPAFYDPRFALSSPASTSKELKEFLMNFYDGELKEFNLTSAEELLSRDAALFEEYKKLSNRKKKDEVYKFIRRFNQAHPVYFLK